MFTKSCFLKLAASFLSATLFGTMVLATVPSQIPYQGRLKDNSGNLLNGLYDLTFTIYDAPASPPGVVLWNEQQTGVNVSNGLFSVQLGSVVGVAPTVFDGSTRFLGIAVAPSGGPFDPEMTPRLPLNTMPYAFRSQTADSVSYAQVYTVALSGGDFASINAALSACNGAPGGHLIRVMPGTYRENVDLTLPGLPDIHLRGAGKNVCTIDGTVIMAGNSLLDGFTIEAGVVCPMTGSPWILHNRILNYIGSELSPLGCGIHVVNDATPWIKENEILRCDNFGIYCQGPLANAWILANLIMGNGDEFAQFAPTIPVGGIFCEEASPHISNNRIVRNFQYGILVAGNEGRPAEPTIDDNVIGYTEPTMPEIVLEANIFGPNMDGVGIQIGDAHPERPKLLYAEPRVLANDIHLNDCGIRIEGHAQPSIVGNDINYNYEEGVICIAQPRTPKQVVIKGNHIHSSNNRGLPPIPGPMNLGLAFDSQPLVTHNTFGDNPVFPGVTDIDYTLNSPGAAPILLYNVYNFLNGNGAPGIGNYNTNRGGGMMAP